MAASFADDCLPPERSFESRQALFESINSWAKPRGYAFSTQRSTKEKNGTSTVIYACDRSCKPPSSLLERQRKTTTRKTNCPFSVIAKETTDGSWTLKHRPDQRFALHNHEPSQHPSATQSIDNSQEAYHNLQAFPMLALHQKRFRPLYERAARWLHGKISTTGLQMSVEMPAKARAQCKR